MDPHGSLYVQGPKKDKVCTQRHPGNDRGASRGCRCWRPPRAAYSGEPRFPRPRPLDGACGCRGARIAPRGTAALTPEATSMSLTRRGSVGHRTHVHTWRLHLATKQSRYFFQKNVVNGTHRQWHPINRNRLGRKKVALERREIEVDLELKRIKEGGGGDVWPGFLTVVGKRRPRTRGGGPRGFPNAADGPGGIPAAPPPEEMPVTGTVAKETGRKDAAWASKPVRMCARRSVRPAAPCWGPGASAARPAPPAPRLPPSAARARPLPLPPTRIR